jgi:hypothetical protein
LLGSVLHGSAGMLPTKEELVSIDYSVRRFLADAEAIHSY